MKKHQRYKEKTASSKKASAQIKKFKTKQGMQVFLEEDSSLPLVNIELVFRNGALFDSKSKEGSMRLFARMLRMGTKNTTALEFEETIDSLGAQLSIQVAHSFISFHATVIRRN
ncbi:MAG: insulinase family protein [Myxococcales bacterium]|nr:MAG: insulinase family protein [Myxococcales bacterium]